MAASTPPPEEPNPVDTAMARLGTRLNAAWTLDEVLGVGGMGVVFAATHTSGSRAALKVLHFEFCHDADLRDRFLREGKIAAHVEHPGRVQMLGEGVSDRGEPFLVMELLAGTTLRRLLKRTETLPIEQILPVFDAVLDLLEKCHAAGVVHRDIKPANIFITGSGQVKVLDFGIARVRDPERQATRAGQTFGTPAFMSPEQAMGLDNVDGRADLWSLGACIYAALAGKRLHDGRTEAEAYLLAATQPAPSLAHAAPHLPVEVVAFVDRALAFDRAKRFQTAAAMRAELRALLSDHAAGRLTPGVTPKAPGVVVRGNDAIEEGDAPLRGAAADQAHQRLVGIWKALALVMSSARQYGFGHPHVAKGLLGAFEELSRALAEAPLAVRWDVTPTAFTLDGKTVWQPDRPPFDRVPYQLFADGIRKIQLKPGVTDVELRDLVAILVSDRSFGAEDSVTALWDRRFEHVAYLAVDSFAEGEAEEREAREEEHREAARALGRLEDAWGEASLEGRAMVRNLGFELLQAGDGAAALAVDPATRASLGAQLAVPPEQWRERYVDAFVDGYLDAARQGDAALMTAALTEWTADQIALRDYKLAFETQAALRRAFAARAEERGAALPAPLESIHRAIAGAMFPPDALQAVLADLTALASADPAAVGAAPGDAAAGQQAPPPSIDPAVVEGIGSALDAVGDGALFAAACACHGVVESERLRGVLSAYVRRFAAGREAEAAEILPRAPLPLALALVDVYAGSKGPEALAVLETALASPHLEARLAALAHLPDAPGGKGRAPGGSAGDRVRDEVQRILEDPRPAMRLEALRAVGKLGLIAAGPALVRRITAADFHTLGADERKLWVEAVALLNPGRAERLSIELLEKRQLIPSESTEQTREIAAQTLFQLGRSHEALSAVKEATKPRWWNTQPVRDAAARAVAAIAARLVAPRLQNGPPTASTMPPAPLPAEGRASSSPPAPQPSTLRPGAPSRPPPPPGSGAPPPQQRRSTPPADARQTPLPQQRRSAPPADARQTPLPTSVRKP